MPMFSRSQEVLENLVPLTEKKTDRDDAENHGFTLLASSISIHWYE